MRSMRSEWLKTGGVAALLAAVMWSAPSALHAQEAEAEAAETEAMPAARRIRRTSSRSTLSWRPFTM